MVDRTFVLDADAVWATSNPADSRTGFGGVARNVAENLARLGVAVSLVSRVGDDEAGRSLTEHLTALKVDVQGVQVSASGATAQYLAVLDPAGDLVIGAAAMQILDQVSGEVLGEHWPVAGARVFADCNLPAATLAQALARARLDGVPLAVDAVSMIKVTRLPADLSGIDTLFCNLDEAGALARHHGWAESNDAHRLATLVRDHGARQVIITHGAAGAWVADARGCRQVPAVSAEVVDVTGAGDALVAGVLALQAAGADLDDAVLAGALIAALTVESKHSVRPDLSAELVERAALERLRRPIVVAQTGPQAPGR